MKKLFLAVFMAVGFVAAADDTNISQTINCPVNLTTNQESGLRWKYNTEMDAYNAATNANPSAKNLVYPGASFAVWFRTFTDKAMRAQADYCYAQKIAAQEAKGDLRAAIKATADLSDADVLKVRTIIEAYSKGTPIKQATIFSAATSP